MTAATDNVVDQVVPSIWKSWTTTSKRSFLYGVLWNVRCVVVGVVCKKWKFVLVLKSVDLLNKGLKN